MQNVEIKETARLTNENIESDGDTLLDSDEVQMVKESEWYAGATIPSYIADNIPHKYIFKEVSDPMKKDTVNRADKNIKDFKLGQGVLS